MHNRRLPAGVDHIYVVTLPQRLHNVRAILGKQLRLREGVDFTIVHATPSASLNIHHMQRSKQLTRAFRSGRVACHMSHLRAMRTFLASPHQTCMVMEDDVYLDGTPEEVVARASEARRHADTQGWDMLYLGFCHEVKSPFWQRGCPVRRARFPLCRHAICYRRHAVERLLPELWPMRGHGDRMLIQTAKRLRLRVLTVQRQLFRQNQREFETTLGNRSKKVEFRPPLSILIPASLAACIILMFILATVLDIRR